MQTTISQIGISEAARMLGVTEETIRRWADSGRLQVTRAERGIRRFDPRDVFRLAMQRRAEMGRALARHRAGARASASESESAGV